MRQIVYILLVAGLGLVFGGTTAWYAVRKNQGVGTINIGEWSAWPFTGGKDVDPYTSAKVTVAGSIPLGASEGLSFEALRDRDGDLLSLKCSYILEGSVPQARMWTLVAYSPNGRRMAPARGGRSAFVSTNLLRYQDGTFSIHISSSPRAGNWMSIDGEGQFQLTMRLYDTPVTSNVGVLSPVMPIIRKVDCRK